MANTSPEFLIDIDSINSNTFTDQGFRKFFKSHQLLIQDSEVRIQNWVEAFYLDLLGFNGSNNKALNEVYLKNSSVSLNNTVNQEDQYSAPEESLAQILTPTIHSTSIPSKTASFYGSAQNTQVQSAFTPKAEPISERNEDVKSLESDSNLRVSDNAAEKINSPNILKINTEAISTHSIASKASELQSAAAAPTLQRPPYFPPSIVTKFLDQNQDPPLAAEAQPPK